MLLGKMTKKKTVLKGCLHQRQNCYYLRIYQDSTSNFCNRRFYYYCFQMAPLNAFGKNDAKVVLKCCPHQRQNCCYLWVCQTSRSNFRNRWFYQFSFQLAPLNAFGKSDEKQFLKVAYSSDKIVAICEFVKIQRPIPAIDGSNTNILRWPY